jgi:exodeoxyribonuclease VII small subunit
MAREKKAAAAAETPDPAALSFEEAIERLQAIVEELEGGSLSLEESIARYEEGVKLSRRLTQTLDEAEKRIERLAEGANREPVTEPMDLEAPPVEDSERADQPGRGPAKSGRAGGGEPEELPF